MADPNKTMLVVSAHSADFVWRAGGAIALHAEQGYRAVVVCLSYGERGESAKLWKEKGMTLERVKEARTVEAENAARILGAEVEFWDLGDYPLRVPDDSIYKLADTFRALQPEFVLTHSLKDPYNFDHPFTTHITQEARVVAQAMGHNPGEKTIGAPPVYLFEPHQTEMCEWRPDVYLDISGVWEKKRQAIEAMTGQEYLWEYYTRVALQRGVQASRNSGRSIRYGEAYQRIFPDVRDLLG